MARISTYQQDTFINDTDLLIGTDGGQINPATGQVIAGTQGRTRNFSIANLTNHIRSRTAEAVSRFDTMLISESPDSELAFSTAYVIHAPGENVRLIIPTVGPSGDAVADGTWIRITFLGNTGGAIFAGSAQPSGRSLGDRFMAGVNADGTPSEDPFLLMIQQNDEVSFELIYVADEITIDGITAPVGWIIVN